MGAKRVNPRQPKGIPTGGQFVGHDRAEGDPPLTAFDPENPGTHSAEGEHVKLEFTYIGEGYEGEYDADDENDVPMYRLDTFVRRGSNLDVDLDGDHDDEWAVPAGASYCTPLPTGTDPALLQRYLSRTVVRIEGLLPHVNPGELLSNFAEETSEITDTILATRGRRRYLSSDLNRAERDVTRTVLGHRGERYTERVVAIPEGYGWPEIELTARTGIETEGVRIEARWEGRHRVLTLPTGGIPATQDDVDQIINESLHDYLSYFRA